MAEIEIVIDRNNKASLRAALIRINEEFEEIFVDREPDEISFGFHLEVNVYIKLQSRRHISESYYIQMGEFQIMIILSGLELETWNVMEHLRMINSNISSEYLNKK